MRAKRKLLKLDYRLILMVLILVILPRLVPTYVTFLMIHTFILAIFALGFNLLFGYAGLLSFGHAAFFSCGVYVSAAALKYWTPSLLVAVLGGTCAAALLATGSGFLCVRHTRIYFAMLTLAIGMMFFAIVWKWREVTGGDEGLLGVPRGVIEIPYLCTIDMKPLVNYYYFVLVVTLISVLILYKIVNSPFGLILQAMRENEVRVEFAGISVKRYRLIAFIISGVFSGVAGALYSPLEGNASPFTSHWTMSAEPVLATLLGGMNYFAGPILGSLLFIFIKDIVMRYTEYWLMWFGIILLALVMVFRGGVISLFYAKGLKSWTTVKPPKVAKGEG